MLGSSPEIMTRTHHDQFAKLCLSGFLTPYGTTEVSREIVSEVRQIDVYFVPTVAPKALKAELGLLGQMVVTPSLLEAFRNPVQSAQILDCQSKLNDVRNEWLRRAKSQGQSLTQQKLPHLWILTPSISKTLLNSFGGQARPRWVTGVYFLPEAQRIGIVSIQQLPEIASTLWLRLLGRGQVQQRAIASLHGTCPMN
jgi:hypothetical protein